MDTYLGHDVPKLGFGLMRLPMLGEAIDIEQVKEMVDLFMGAGFNYFDTAYGYGAGASERAAKEALVDRYPRESFLLATKLPAWSNTKCKEDAQQMFYTSLERTGAGYFDYYLLHNLGGNRTQAFDDYDIWDFVAQRKKEGLIRHVGFSIHDSAEALDKVLTEHPEVEFVQLQINYADWESPSVQSRLCYETALRHGKPIIIMEPVKGGNLASPPPAVRELFSSVAPDMSPSSWGVRFAASLDNVITVLSGMSNLEQMRDNLSYMADFKPFTQLEMDTVHKAREIYDSIPTVPCTQCAYCMDGCPENIAIFGAFEAYNEYKTYGNLDLAKSSYEWATKGKAKASKCIGCGQCEAVCPQKISIVDELKNVAELFGE